MLVRRRTPAEVGWFGAKIVRKATGAVSSVAKTATKAATAVPGLKTAVSVAGKIPGVKMVVAPAALAADIAQGRNIIRSARARGTQWVSGAREGLPTAAAVVGVVPGVGTAIAVPLSATAALSAGKSPRQIAEEAALAAIPGGQLAKAGLSAATKVARGQNVARALREEAVSYAVRQVPGGSQLAERALAVGKRAIKGENVIQAVGREALSYGASALPAAIPTSVRTAVSSVTQAIPRGSMPLISARPSYGLPSSISPENVRRTMRVVSPRRPDLGPLRVAKAAKASFRPLSQATRNMLVRALPRMRGEVAGLSETGTQWIVESGDTGSKIALKLTGNANRWTELKAVNPTIMNRGADLVKKYGFPIYVGDKVNLPATWIKVTAKPPAQAAPATPTITTAPPVEMPSGDLAAQGQARTILAAWGKSDGINEAGRVGDYGGSNELNATGWTGRDVLQADAFATWWNKQGISPSVPNGYWNDNLARALNTWAERKAAQVTQTAAAAGGIVIPTLTPAVSTPTPTPVSTTAPNGSTPTQVAIPTVTVPTTTIAIPNITTPTTIALPSVVTTPAATTTTTPSATTAPAASQQAGLSDNQKWALGSLIVGSVGSGLIRLVFV